MLGRAAAGRDAAAELPAVGRTRCGTRCPGGFRNRSWTSGSRSTPSTPTGSPARSGSPAGSTSCCRPASSRSRRCCPASRPSPGSRSRCAKTYGNRGAEVLASGTGRGGRRRGRAAPDRGARRTVTSDPRAGAAGARVGAPEFVRTVTAEMMAGRGDAAAGQRTAGGRHLPERHDGLREAQHLRARRGVGSRQLHPVRQLRFRLPAQRDPVEVLRRVPTGGRTGRNSTRHRWTRSACPNARFSLQVYVEDCTGCGLCVEACPVVVPGARRHQGDQPRPRRAAGASPSGRTSASSSRCRPTTGPGWTSARCAAPSSSSRCSSSPAPAPAAARRPTSSCCRSCSETG